MSEIVSKEVQKKCYYYHNEKARIFDAELLYSSSSRYNIKYIDENGKEVNTWVSKSHVRRDRQKALSLTKNNIINELKDLEPRMDKLNNALAAIEWELETYR